MEPTPMQDTPLEDVARTALQRIAADVRPYDRLCADAIVNEAAFAMPTLEHRVGRSLVLLDALEHGPPMRTCAAFEAAVRAILRQDLAPALFNAERSESCGPVPFRLMVVAIPPSVLFQTPPFREVGIALARARMLSGLADPSTAMWLRRVGPARSLVVFDGGQPVLVEYRTKLSPAQFGLLRYLDEDSDGTRPWRQHDARPAAVLLESGLIEEHGGAALRLTDSGRVRLAAEGRNA